MDLSEVKLFPSKKLENFLRNLKHLQQIFDEKKKNVEQGV